MTEHDRILLAVLAEIDAVWIPDRQPMKCKRHTAIFERRKVYHATGVVLVNLAGAGADAAERQRASRALRELAADGLVTCHKPKWARALSVKLTPAGDDRARALAGLPVFDYDLLVRLRGLNDSPLAIDVQGPVYSTVGVRNELLAWHSENALAGSQAGEAIAGLQLEMLPLIVRGYVASGSQINGSIWYALTPAGQVAAQEPEIEIDWTALPEPTRQAEELYWTTFEAAFARLEVSPPRQPAEIGELPLPGAPLEPRPGASEAWAKFWEGMKK